MARILQLPDRSPLIRQPLLLSVISLRRCYRKGKVGVRRPGGASSLGRGAFQLAGEGFSFGVQNETGPFWRGPTWECPGKGLGNGGDETLELTLGLEVPPSRTTTVRGDRDNSAPL